MQEEMQNQLSGKHIAGALFSGSKEKTWKFGGGFLTLLMVFLVEAGSTSVCAETVPLRSVSGALVVRVLVNNQVTLDFMLDSGAADVSIPADVFSTLVRTRTIETSDNLDTQVYELADGTRTRTQRFRIRTLRVGSVELRDVVASVAPQAGPLLLGQSFLSRIKTWSIDNQRQLLFMNESPAGASTGFATPPQTAPKIASATGTATMYSVMITTPMFVQSGTPGRMVIAPTCDYIKEAPLLGTRSACLPRGLVEADILMFRCAPDGNDEVTGITGYGCLGREY